MTTQLEAFAREINDAFARGDIAFFEEILAGDVHWEMVGGEVYEGREAVLEMMRAGTSGDLPELTTDSVITHGRQAAVEGRMRLAVEDGVVKDYGYCDVYEMTGAGRSKIKAVRSYIIEL